MIYDLLKTILSILYHLICEPKHAKPEQCFNLQPEVLYNRMIKGFLQTNETIHIQTGICSLPSLDTLPKVREWASGRRVVSYLGPGGKATKLKA